MLDKQRKELQAALARSLTKVYESYENHQYESALASGKPPPIKKQKLASNPSPATPAAPAVPESPLTPPGFAALPLRDILRVSAVVHKNDMDAKYYEVPQPSYYGTPEFYDDDEYSSSGEGQASDRISAKPVFLTRSNCAKPECCKPVSGGSKPFFSLPEYIFWRDTRAVPDGCPICKRVLFKKSKLTASSGVDLFGMGY